MEIIHSPENTSGPLILELINKPSSVISLQVISEKGCKSEIKSLNFKRKPVFSFGSDTNAGCTPLQIKFRALPGDEVDKIDYRWSFGDGESIAGPEVVHTFSQPDQLFSVALKGDSKTTGCSDSTKKNGYILTYNNPKAGFSMNPEIAYNDASQVSFSDLSQNAVRYLWDFSDGRFSFLQNPKHQFETIGAHKILQTVYNEFGCMDSISMDLMVVLRKIYTPNAIDPYAANVNDREFKPYSKGIAKEGYHLKIYSRWNDVIFECKNEIKGWDGKLSNGKVAQPGNYIWILEFVDLLGNKHRQMGTVMLIN
jgi:PKD repeat protein